ncbi:hypothetical protein BPAE_0182g00080 [Botrytis paeoniae]|uniref:AMP-dependent synthetase/ligase domain-containing protein n=1 Tax=Botrytis paeoniae TaxID=278948 RepID=A0A4Z1FKP8_9HELO|nr:hypothetical protein BPAE_0182g00080 [Botrytis paeoniae]
MTSILFGEISLKPIRCKQLLNNIVDGLAKVRPGTIYAEVSQSATSYQCGYRKISYANFANAINGLAHWLHDTLGPAEKFPTLAYVGPNDFRYNALILGAVKAGYKQARKKPLAVLHTSDTTGFPKPIVWNHEWVGSWSDWLAIAPSDGYTNQTALWTSKRLLNTLPSFHADGIFMTLLNAVFNQKPLIYPLSHVPFSTQIVLEALKHVKADIVLLAPQFVEEVGKNPEMLDFLVKNIEMLLYGGGDVSQATGDKISKRLKLSMIIGSTKSGAYPAVFPSDKWPSDDLKYFHFHPNAGMELRLHSENRYEAVLTRDTNPEKTQPIFSVFLLLNEWETYDLYASHPSIPDLWLYSGRSDDIIVLLTGEKPNPVSMEQQISYHPEIRAALVIGAHRFQTALLIELISPQVLSTVEQAKAVNRTFMADYSASKSGMSSPC